MTKKTKTSTRKIKDLTPVKSTAEVIVALEVEFDEIAGRVERLNAALNLGDTFIKKVGEEQYSLLCDQFNFMREYRDILAVRLSLLRRANAKVIEDEVKAKAVKA